MNTPAPQNLPPLQFDAVIRAIGVPARCAILGALSDGQPRMVNEIAKMIGHSPGLVSKHLAVLRGAGLVVLTRRLYQIPAPFIADAAKGQVDYGHCLLRLPGAAGQPAA